jgi:hypothetical protein
MKRMMTVVAMVAAAAALTSGRATAAPQGRAAGANRAAHVTAVATAAAPRIDVVFLLDTTASMGGLIEGAKLKIWSIANQMIAAKPRPKLRIGLVAYRDRGDQYVTQFFELSEDIDAVYANLQGFRADGGGDGPESVNQALHEAVTRPAWDPGRDVLKVIFLVGDFPPHMDYANDVKYPITCQQAAKRDIIINTVQCGQNDETARAWQDIARLAEGSYMAIGQTGDMTVATTPMDAELAELNRALGRTIVAYGDTGAREEAKRRQARSEVAPAAVAAERLAYKAAAASADAAAGIPLGVAGGVVGGVVGGGDLVDDERAGRTKLDALAKDKLPAEMQGLSVEEQRAYLAKRRAEREALQGRIAELVKKRQAYVEAEMKKAAAAGHKDAFDARIAETIQTQAARKGMHYEVTGTHTPSTTASPVTK